MGERGAEAPLPGLVPLRALPQAPGRRPAPAGGHLGGAALRHRGAGGPRLRHLHPGLGALQEAPQREVWGSALHGYSVGCYGRVFARARVVSHKLGYDAP